MLPASRGLPWSSCGRESPRLYYFFLKSERRISIHDVRGSRGGTPKYPIIKLTCFKRGRCRGPNWPEASTGPLSIRDYITVKNYTIYAARQERMRGAGSVEIFLRDFDKENIID